MKYVPLERMSTEKRSCVLNGFEQLFVPGVLCPLGLMPHVSEANERKPQATRQPETTEVPSAETLTFSCAHTVPQCHPTQSKATNQPPAFPKALLPGFANSDGEELVAELEGLCSFAGYVLIQLRSSIFEGVFIIILF